MQIVHSFKNLFTGISPLTKGRRGILVLIFVTMTACTIQITMTKKTTIKNSKPRFRNHYNYKHMFSDHEHVPGESIAEPGQSLTIKEILQRFTSGIPLPENEMHFDDTATLESDTTFRDPDRDLTHLDDKVNQEINQKIEKQDDRSESDLKDPKEGGIEATEDLSEKGSSEADDPKSEDPK